jgi:hypothetical protein
VDLVDIDEEILDEAEREEDEQATTAGDPLIGAERTWASAMEKDAASADDLGIMQAKNPNPSSVSNAILLSAPNVKGHPHCSR